MTTGYYTMDTPKLLEKIHELERELGIDEEGQDGLNRQALEDYYEWLLDESFATFTCYD